MAGTQSLLMALCVLTLVDAQNFENGRAVWNLTVNEPVVKLQLNGTEEMTILATEEVPIAMSLGRGNITINITINCSDIHGYVILLDNVIVCSRPGLNISQPLKLVFKLNNNEYEVLANGKKLISSERVEDGRGTPLTVKAYFMENMTGSVYMVQSHPLGVPPPLPEPPPPASQDTSASLLVVGLTSTLVVFLMLLIASVVINVLLLRLLPLGILPAWVQGKPAPTQHQVVGLKEVSTVPQGTARNMDDTESRPELPPRPIETFATTSAVPPVAPKGNYVPKNDPDYDYITAQDVKPLEVEILKQQKLIQGQICYATSPKPSSAFGSAHL